MIQRIDRSGLNQGRPQVIYPAARLLDSSVTIVVILRLFVILHAFPDHDFILQAFNACSNLLKVPHR